MTDLKNFALENTSFCRFFKSAMFTSVHALLLNLCNLRVTGIRYYEENIWFGKIPLCFLSTGKIGVCKHRYIPVYPFLGGKRPEGERNKRKIFALEMKCLFLSIHNNQDYIDMQFVHRIIKLNFKEIFQNGVDWNQRKIFDLENTDL